MIGKITSMAMETNPEDFQSKIKFFVAAAKEILRDNIVSIILFGSTARNDAHESSDADFYIVVNEYPEDDYQVKLRIWKATKYGIDIVIRTERDIINCLERLNSLELEIFQDGLVIYGVDVLSRYRQVFDAVKTKYQLEPHPELGKGVWLIGTAVRESIS